MSVEFTQIRQAVADYLTQTLGAGWLVYSYPRALSALNTGVGVVIVNRTKVAPSAAGLRNTTIELHVIEPAMDSSTAEDALETRLDAVLDALDGSDLSAAFTSAERAMYPVGDSAAQSYVVTLDIETRK